jgi:hypothetical protein
MLILVKDIQIKLHSSHIADGEDSYNLGHIPCRGYLYDIDRSSLCG